MPRYIIDESTEQKPLFIVDGFDSDYLVRIAHFIKEHELDIETFDSFIYNLAKEDIIHIKEKSLRALEAKAELAKRGRWVWMEFPIGRSD